MGILCSTGIVGKGGGGRARDPIRGAGDVGASRAARERVGTGRWSGRAGLESRTGRTKAARCRERFGDVALTMKDTWPAHDVSHACGKFDRRGVGGRTSTPRMRPR